MLRWIRTGMRIIIRDAWADDQIVRLMKINGNRLYIDECLTEIADWEERGPWTILKDIWIIFHQGFKLFLLFLFCKVGLCHSDDYYFSGPDKFQFQLSTELNRNRCSHRFDCGVIGVYYGSTFDYLGKLHPLGINSAVHTLPTARDTQLPLKQLHHHNPIGMCYWKFCAQKYY